MNLETLDKANALVNKIEFIKSLKFDFKRSYSAGIGNSKYIEHKAGFEKICSAFDTEVDELNKELEAL